MIITRLLAFKLPCRANLMLFKSFSDIKPENQQISLDLKATLCKSFYQKTIRKVNVQQKTGRGKFTEHALIRMIKLSTPSDLELLFEAYYNYMGHFTMYSQKTVDSLVHKAMHLAKLNPEVKEAAAQKILELLKHHEYLRYYPSFKATKNVAQFMKQNGRFIDFLNILQEKLLIKINSQIFDDLIRLSQNWREFSKIVKIGAYRMNWNILEGLSKDEFIKKVSKDIERFNSFKMAMKSPPCLQLFNSIEPQNRGAQLAICYLIFEEDLGQSIKIIRQLEQGDPAIINFMNVVRKLDQDSSNKIMDKVQKLLQNTQHSELFKES